MEWRSNVYQVCLSYNRETDIGGQHRRRDVIKYVAVAANGQARALLRGYYRYMSNRL